MSVNNFDLTDSDFKVEATRDLFEVNAGRLKKQVDMLAIAPQDKRISILTRKIYNIMMVVAQNESPDVFKYRVALTELVKGLDFNSKDTGILKEHLRQMTSTTVEWQSPSSTEGESWGVTALISQARIIKNTAGVYLEWMYSESIRQRVLEPTRYAVLSLRFQNLFRTHAGLTLYEICIRYVDNPGKVTARQPWAWWRPVLTGEPDMKGEQKGIYAEYKFFNNRIIKKSIQEVNAVSDIEIELVEFKAGRTVLDLQFKVKRKKLAKKPGASMHEPIDLKAVGRCIRSGIPQDKAEILLDRYGGERLEKALDSLEARIAKSGMEPVRNPYAFIRTVIEQLSKPDLFNAAEPMSPPIPEELIKSEQLKLLGEYRVAKKTEALSLFEEMTQAEQSNFDLDFEIYVYSFLNAVVQETFRKSKRTKPIVKAEFEKYVAMRVWGDHWNTPSDSELLKFSMTRKLHQ